MYSFEPSDAAACATMRRKYLKSLSAPKDGMWETFVDMGSFYLIKKNEEISGYLVLNQDKYVIQYYTQTDGDEVFSKAIVELEMVGSFVATSEAEFLNFSEKHQKSVTVSAHMYHVPKDAELPKTCFTDGAEFRALVALDFEDAVTFALNAIGAPEDWLRGYYTERIEKSELYGLYLDGKLIAAGECRLSPLQENVADLGIVVSPSHRRKGIATDVLIQLLHFCRDQGWLPVCSTEDGNIGAQKAILNARFAAYHKILQINF